MHIDTKLVLLQKRDKPSASFPSTVVTLVVILIALLVFLVLLSISRLYFFRYRRSLLDRGVIPMRTIHQVQLPVQDINPPPVFVRKFERFVYNNPHTMNNWAETHPFAVTLDRRASCPMEDSQDATQNIQQIKSCANRSHPTIQTSFLVSLPTPNSKFPSHLRRRTQPHVGAGTQNINSKDLMAQIPAERSSSDDISKIATAGEQRCDGVLKHLERCDTDDQQTSGLAKIPSTRSTLTAANQQSIKKNTKRMETNEKKEEKLGSFGLGTVSFTLCMSDSSASKENQAIPSAELTRIIDRAQQIQSSATTIV